MDLHRVPGTDGSTVFRGGIGHSDSCQIESLTPLYGQMREYLPR
ncbi:MAG TPA: hypothetical protein VGS07_27985 [Thermoanaerobaculia bacterium]|nr:hypothetical protein [Thermoanaerobaculia bacterium]